MSSDNPMIDRPIMPAGYGVPADSTALLTWADVEPRLVESAVYWLATTRPDGRPHVVPRWGVWVDGAFWYDGSPQTRHVRNLVDNAACTLHLEDGTRAVIVEGIAGPATPPEPALAARLSAAFGKYKEQGYTPGPDSWQGELAGGLCRLAPTKALAWLNFPVDVTRFRWP
jgi:nitroimidazol reductase NimA-like FMN-containing flavoprotein (pyridoxamine 5'-phosphate oxidase superfamily)